MERVLRKRLPRDLRAGLGRYLALILVIAMGIFLVIGIVGSAETIIHGAEAKRDEFCTEDGFFSVFLPLSDSETEKLSEGGTVIEAEFYTDLKVDEDTRLRMFKNRRNIDKLILDEGRLAEADGECVIEKRYAEENKLSPGDTVRAGGKEFRITGIGTVPDYDQPKAKFSDTAVQSKYFGLIFVTEDFYEKVRAGGDLPAEEYVYAYRLGSGITDDDLKDRIKAVKLDYEKVDDKYFREQTEDILKQKTELESFIDMIPGGQEKYGPLLDKVFDLNMENLISFVPRGNNERIEAAAGDMIMDRNAGLVAGVIILILFGYVISVFVVHRVESEAPVIGALYSLGVKKKDLLRHYITLPTVIAFIGGAIGTALGFSPIGIGVQVKDSYGYFSLPQYDIYYAPYLIVYGLVLPPVISAVVNALTINKKLSRTALSLLRNEQNASGFRRFRVRSKSFITMFRIRQMVRELRSAVTVVAGMLVSLMVVMLGLDCLVMCQAVKENNAADTDYAYMYLYKYPEAEVPAGGEGAFVKTLSTESTGYTLDVMFIGLEENSRYFDARPEKGKNKAVINNSLVERFGFGKGDRVTFTDRASDIDHSFTVTDTVQYSPGFTVFMDIGSMRELFGENENYFNAVYSDRELDIDPGRLYSVTSKSDIEKSAGVFVDQMASLVWMLLIAGTVIFVVVMYLMMGVMIDRSSFGISLIKIFGYRPKEVRSLYLNGNLIVVSVGALICIPLAKFIIDRLYPGFIPNVACSMVLSFPPYLYAIVYAAVLAVYFVSSGLLTRKLSRITPAEVLKNRE